MELSCVSPTVGGIRPFRSLTLPASQGIARARAGVRAGLLWGAAVAGAVVAIVFPEELTYGPGPVLALVAIVVVLGVTRCCRPSERAWTRSGPEERSGCPTVRSRPVRLRGAAGHPYGSTGRLTVRMPSGVPFEDGARRVVDVLLDGPRRSRILDPCVRPR